MPTELNSEIPKRPKESISFLNTKPDKLTLESIDKFLEEKLIKTNALPLAEMPDISKAAQDISLGYEKVTDILIKRADKFRNDQAAFVSDALNYG